MKTVFSLLILALSFTASGQVPFKWDISGALGITSYQGDLDAFRVNAGFREIKYAASLSLRRNVSNFYALRLNAMAGRIAGDDRNFAEPEWRIRRGIAFESTLIELSVLNEFYPFGMYPKKGKPSRGRSIIAPYGLVGFGWAHSNPKVNWNDANGNEEIDPDKAALDKKAKTNKLHVVIPIGFGVRFRLKDHSTFMLEAALRPTFSDYLDGISLAGNPDKNDWFFTAQIGVNYPFGKNKARNKDIARKEKAEKAEKAEAIERAKVAQQKEQAPKEQPQNEHTASIPSDIDKDGVPDIDDECPAVPGLKSLKGCPDKDKDGIADNDDECPDQPGTPDNKGCPVVDTDHDGVPDNKDLCPDKAGPGVLGGCPDTDADGIADKDDECPDLPGTAARNGCPSLPPPDKAVYFKNAQSDWFRTSDETMEEIAMILKNDPSLKARISGHSDDTSESATSGLSDLRAKKVYDYLVSEGIAASRLEYAGYGSSRPVDTKLLSDDPQLNHQLQRRVEGRFYRR